MMEPSRWQQLQAVFHNVVDLPADQRSAVLDEQCAGDEELKKLVGQLLEGEGGPGSLLDSGLGETAAQLLDEPSPAGQFGPYAVVELIDEGGMGVVYLAERRDLGQRVAIKVLRDAWVSPARLDRFASEQRTLARLHHPSIAQLFDAATLPDGTPYFVMEYVEGLHLTTYCATHDSTVKVRLALFRQCCAAVQHAHQQLVVHRDLKPSNIMVTADGSVKLLDFGIAKEMESLQGPVDQTQAFRAMTPQYAAPEQIGGGQVGVFTDVYSLGVIIYELLAGRLPHQATDVNAPLLDPHDRRQPVAASVAARATGRSGAASRSEWADLDVLCARAMHVDPSRRYATVEALLRDLDRFERGQPLEARRDSLGYRTGKFARRHRAGIAAAALAFLVVVGVSAFYTVRLTRARSAELAEAARRERVQSFMLRLFDAGDQAAAPSDDLKVLSLLDRGVNTLNALDSEPRVQAELLFTLGSVYERLGKYPQAEALLQRSLDQRRAAAPSDSTDVPDSLVAMSLLRLRQSQWDEAERLARESLEIARRTTGPGNAGVARATMMLGRVHDARGAHDRAIPLLEEALRLFSSSGTPQEEIAQSLTALANSHYYSGHLDRAEELNLRALAINTAAHGTAHPTVGDGLLNLGTIQYDRGRYGESETYRRRALDSLRVWYGDTHPETGSAMMLVAQSVGMQKRYDDAEALLRGALAIHEKAYGATHPRVALVLNDLAIVQTRNARPDLAEELFSRALAIFRKVYPDGHSRTAVAMSNLASVYMARNEMARAEQGFRDALRLYAQVYPKGHANIDITRIKLGHTLVAQRRYREAEAELSAGYATLVKTMVPSTPWLQSARADLAIAYDALGQPDKARTYRDEHAAIARQAPAVTAARR